MQGPTASVTVGICYLWFAASMSYYGISYNSGNLSSSTYMDWVLVRCILLVLVVLLVLVLLLVLVVLVLVLLLPLVVVVVVVVVLLLLLSYPACTVC